MTVDFQLQVRNAREERQMSDTTKSPDAETSADLRSPAGTADSPISDELADLVLIVKERGVPCPPKCDYQTHRRAEVRAELEAAYPAIRQQVAEEIAAALEAVPSKVYPEDIFLPDGTSVDAQTARVMRFAYPAAARIAREIGGGQ